MECEVLKKSKNGKLLSLRKWTGTVFVTEEITKIIVYEKVRINH